MYGHTLSNLQIMSITFSVCSQFVINRAPDKFPKALNTCTQLHVKGKLQTRDIHERNLHRKSMSYLPNLECVIKLPSSLEFLSSSSFS